MDKQPAYALRSYYVNFASHLLNSWNVNMTSPEAGGGWGPGEFGALFDMIKSFGFNCFEFWLEPTLYKSALAEDEVFTRFAATMEKIIDIAHDKGLMLKYILAPNTIGHEWYLACPNDPADRALILKLWRKWAAVMKGADIVGIFPGDPGGCNRNGCDHNTFLDLALELTEIVAQENPRAVVELGTWGTPFTGWGDDMLRMEGWDGYFASMLAYSEAQKRVHIWNGTPDRAKRAMADFIQRLPQFPRDMIVGINLGFSPDADCTMGGDARPFVREIAKSHPIASWDYSVAEGELVVHPHWRLPRIFSRRREEYAVAPYYGAMSYTMSPMLSHLCLYAAGQATIDPDRDPDLVSREFCRRVFGAENERLGELFEAFEVVPGWGHYPRRKWSAIEARKAYGEIIERLEGADMAGCDLPLFPSPERYRQSLLWFARLFHRLASPAPDRGTIRNDYYRECYRVYDKAPKAVDERPAMAADTFSRLFSEV